MLSFREHLEADIIWRVKWLNDKETNQFVIDDPKHQATVDEQQQWFAKYWADRHKRFFTICYDKQPIGFMGLSNIDEKEGRASVFILIGEKKYRGCGFGKEALKYLVDFSFNNIKLKFLTLEVNKNNSAAIGLYQSLGFIKIGDRAGEIQMTLSKESQGR